MSGGSVRMALGGRLLQVRTSGPLIAAGLSVPVPADQVWNVATVIALFTATASVGNRIVTIELLDDGDQPIAIVVSSQAIVAGQTIAIAFGPGGFASSTQGTSPLAWVWEPWPVLVAVGGQRFRITDQAGIDIADTAKILISGKFEPGE